MTRLYQFYNMIVSKDGAAFPLCDTCRKAQLVPEGCILNKIADKAVYPCTTCGKEGK